jgi:hypothetical protein
MGNSCRSTTNSFNSSSNDDEMIQKMFVDMDVYRQFATSSFHMFNANELDKGIGQSMDLGVGVWDVLAIMGAMQTWLFKILINFILVEFNELASLMVPTIAHHAQSTL